MLLRKLYSAAAMVVLTTMLLATSAQAKSIDPLLVENALCIHSGWHYTHIRVRGQRPEYHLFGHWFWRTTKTWSNGEGSWTGIVGNLYGGGLSFMVSTYNRAGAPYASSTSDIARASPEEQIRRLLVIVAQDGGSYREWPVTSRACGL